MNDTPKKSSEVSQNLALDELADKDKQRQVEAYVQKRKEIADMAKGKRAEMRELMREMNRMNASPDKIIEAILQRLFSKNLEKKVRSSYPDKFADILIEFNINLEGDDDTKEELNSNTVFKKARGKVLSSIQGNIDAAQQARGKFLKPKYIDEFAEAVMRRYMKSMDEDIWGRVTESNVDSDLKILTFDEWRMNNPSYSDETLFFDFSPEEARKFVGDIATVKGELNKIKLDTPGLNKKLSMFFKKEREAIEDKVMANPDNFQNILKEAEKLTKAYTASLAFIEMKKKIDARLKDVEALKKKLSDLDPSIEKKLQKLAKDLDAAITDFIEKKGAGTLAMQKKPLEEVDKKLAKEKERLKRQEQAAQQQEAEEKQKEEAEKKKEEAEKEAKEKFGPNPLEDPDGWLEHMGKQAGPFGALLASLLAGHPIFEKFKKFLKKIQKKGDAAKEAPRLVKSQPFFQEKFEMKADEATEVATMDVAAFLKLTRSPSGVREKPFKALQASLKANGATQGTPGTVLDFVEKKRSSWKESEAAES